MVARCAPVFAGKRIKLEFMELFILFKAAEERERGLEVENNPKSVGSRHDVPLCVYFNVCLKRYFSI